MNDWNGTGLSVLEMSHRGKFFDSIQKKTRADLKQLMSIPDEFEILFFQGGATCSERELFKLPTCSPQASGHSCA
jgi:phosphoserine aminotransferase